MIETEILTDKEIIARVLHGDKALYEMIVRRYNPYLYKTGRSYNYHHADTLDLMQETYIDAFKHLGQFEGRAEFKTWIIRIMLNHCYRRKRQSGFKHELSKEILEHATPMFTSNHHTPDHMVHNRELGHILETALGKIPHDYRMVFSLREINGLNVAETASLLNITESNVKVRLNRAKSMLRNEIEKTYSPQELFEFNLIYCDAMVERVMEGIRE